MVSIRIEGAVNDVREAKEYLVEHCQVVSSSDKFYRNRAPSNDVRAYMSVNFPSQKESVSEQEIKQAYTKSKEEKLI